MIGFTGSPLDRCEHLRADPETIARLAADPAARLIDLAALGADFAGTAIPWQPMRDGPVALLGTIGGAPRFVAIGEQVPPRSFALVAALSRLDPGEAATYGAARSLADWHARHGFCANCGTATGLFRAGWGRRCEACGTEHYPRTDPVVIMLAEHEGHVLVGRQPTFPPGLYSALAGFVEPGESVEEAVARELNEEAGVVTTAVRYLASQPWPFPSQLMLACVATVESDALTLDATELEDALWIDRDGLAAVLAGTGRFAAPARYAIARSLMAMWLAGK